MEETQARSKALHLLGQREHSRKELRQKLRATGCEETLADSVLDTLTAQRYLDDERYAEALVSKRRRQGYGPGRIRQELQQAGIDSDSRRRVLEASEHDWAQAARQVYQKKYGTRLVCDAREKARRARYMFSKGYSQEHLRSCLDCDDIDDIDNEGLVLE